MTSGQPSVGIVGGGLAGLAAASVLCERGFRVEIFEARRFLGGRAGSFVDRASGELVDHCQHVAMGCCTKFLDFCRRTEVEHLFRRDKQLHFFSPEGKRFDVQASPWLPAPLHLGPSLLRLRYLSRREKWDIAKTLFALARLRATEDDENSPAIGQWLRERGQSQRAIDRFWSVVLVSALGETVDRASLAAARKVFVDGFMARRDGYHVYVPQAPLGEIYENGIACWLKRRGVQIRLESRVTGLSIDGEEALAMDTPTGPRSFTHYMIAVPWHKLPKLLGVQTLGKLDGEPASITGSPITSLHLWFDRPIMTLPHAVFVDRLTQWVFRHHRVGGAPHENVEHASWRAREEAEPGTPGGAAHAYYQVIISASRDLAGRSKDSILAEVLGDLGDVFPEAKSAMLLRHRIVTQQDAVFSYRPGLDRIRPVQQTFLHNLYLAGDWTHTGWPSTMESAVRSGYLAAAKILEPYGDLEMAESLELDLPPNRFARWLLRQ